MSENASAISSTWPLLAKKPLAVQLAPPQEEAHHAEIDIGAKPAGPGRLVEHPIPQGVVAVASDMSPGGA
jgi:hypothetical protein